MGPSVKFISAIKDAFSTNKWGQFLLGSKTIRGGVRGRDGKRQNYGTTLKFGQNYGTTLKLDKTHIWDKYGTVKLFKYCKKS